MICKIIPLKPFGVLLEPENKNTKVTEIDIENLRKLFSEEHLIVLRGFITFNDSDDFANYRELWGEISLWPFGKVLDIVERENAEDHIFDSSSVPLHWDGMYRPQIPEYQIFHCVKAPLPEHGGRTTFSNTILALKYASTELKNLWNKVTGIYHRKMEFYNSKVTSPIITKHPLKNYLVIRYNEAHSETEHDFVNPPDLKFSGVSHEELELFHRSLTQALYAPGHFYAHEWQAGDVVIADNFSLLHGREKFISKSPRHLRRVQVLSNPHFNNPGLEFYK